MWRSYPLNVDWAGLVVAQASSGDLPGWLPVVASAIGGILATILSGRLVVPTFAYAREVNRADFWQAEYMALSKQVSDKVVVALTESTASVKDALVVFGRRS